LFFSFTKEFAKSVPKMRRKTGKKGCSRQLLGEEKISLSSEKKRSYKFVSYQSKEDTIF
jgi:hypothetical protein